MNILHIWHVYVHATWGRWPRLAGSRYRFYSSSVSLTSFLRYGIHMRTIIVLLIFTVLTSSSDIVCSLRAWNVSLDSVCLVLTRCLPLSLSFFNCCFFFALDTTSS